MDKRNKKQKKQIGTEPKIVVKLAFNNYNTGIIRIMDTQQKKHNNIKYHYCSII